MRDRQTETVSASDAEVGLEEPGVRAIGPMQGQFAWTGSLSLRYEVWSTLVPDLEQPRFDF